VTTCGLTYAGATGIDEGKPYGLHGRASNLPAYNVCADGEWENDIYVMWVQGKIRETAVFGPNIELVRTISARLGESKIWIHDKVTNLGYADTEHMILYHCNFGFPVVDKGSRVVAPVKDVKPRDAAAEPGLSQHMGFSEPINGYAEQVFYLEMAEDKHGNVDAALVNDAKGLGVYLRYPKKELPKFTEWKMMGQGTYVVGYEPANCWVEGRAKERERGTLQYLQPGETREYHLEIGVLPSADAIKKFEEGVKGIMG
jgi:hypothetical protein